MPNHLAQETSPYLLQHRENPVDWYPWGEEALKRAREEGKPVFLSIGYSACHWCHVMERESFMDRETAELLNQHFISIKVDREERPDLDSIYMEAVQAMTGSGGWPLSVFLTPRGEPFFGGTYFPPEDRYGIPSFRKVLVNVVEAYHTRRAEIDAHAGGVAGRIGARISLEGDGQPAAHVPEGAAKGLAEGFDERHGGFGGAPKFPQPMVLDFLLRHGHRTRDDGALRMVDRTMEAMARGGIYDLLGGGFHRYSTDPYWLVPHFEKMLYDNALLARLYLHGYRKTGNPLFRAIAEETIDYVLREMTSPEGGFYSTQDADSEGEEGKFFLWTAQEIDGILGEEKGRLFRLAYGATEEGNFEGKNILHRLGDWSEVVKRSKRSPSDLEAVLGEAERALFAAREKRAKPGRDEKVLTAWNGLMIAALADGARALGREEVLAAAVRGALFVERRLSDGGRLLRSWKDGTGKIPGYLEDYSYYADGLLALYQATSDKRWFLRAVEIADRMIAHFADSKGGGFYDTADDHEELIARPKGVQDNATPSGNAAANRVLLTLAAFTGESRFALPAAKTLSAMQGVMESHPIAFGHWLGNLEFVLAAPKEVAIVGDPRRRDMAELVQAAFRGYRPNQVVAAGAPEDGEAVPLLRDRPLVDGRPTAYVCRNFTCQLPITDPEELSRTLDS